jgi:ParB family chromosome partitioning protein
MASRVDFRKVVAERSRRIAGEARARAASAAGGAGGDAPRWLRVVVEALPARAQDALRAALDVDRGALEAARALMAQARREKDDLRHREAALDGARADLDRARRALDAARAEVRGQEAEAERLLARAQRAADEAATVRRVPLGAVVVDEDARPRPLRGVARLAANLERFGQLTPVVVRPLGADRFELVTGYRRMAALAAARFTHVDVRVVPDLDDATAAALYVAENCLVEGVSSKAVERLAERLAGAAGFAEVLPQVLADDENVEEDVYLEDMAAEARDALAEGAGWVAALRPHWADLDDDDRVPLEQLVVYFAKIARRLRIAP